VPRRYRFGPYEPGDELDASEALRAMVDDLSYHGNLAEALRELLRRGIGDTPGLAKLLERLRAHRDELLATYDPSATVRRIAEELDAIVAAERSTREQRYASSGDETDLVATMELDALPSGLGERLRALESYEFADLRAKERFDALMDELRSSLAAGEARRLRDMLAGADPAETAALANALSDLIERYQQGEDVEEDFQALKERFPGIAPPEMSFAEFLEEIAASAQRTQALLASLDPEAREELMDLMAALADNAEVARALARLGQALAPLVDTEGYGFVGQVPLGLGELEGVMDVLGRLDALETALTSASSPERLRELDADEVGDLLGPDAKEALSQLGQLADRLAEAGLIDRSSGRQELTMKAIRQIGKTVLERLFAPGSLALLGEHESRRLGNGQDLAYETKPYEFGDPFRLNLRATLREAISRRGPGVPVQVVPEDFVIDLGEERARVSTVLALDLSLSMPLNDTFLPAKQVALALSTLIASRFPRDYLGLVVFSEVAREVEARSLPTAQWDYVYGTNIEHALALSRAMLASQSGQRQILLVTDGEPTSHIDPATKEVFFSYPPSRETISRTLAEVRRCTRAGIAIHLFVLNADRRLRGFVEEIQRINRGRLWYATGRDLGTTLIEEFLASHRGR
jgi:uncharacterized protein with von Willebrand factor type A (vWA) domain